MPDVVTVPLTDLSISTVMVPLPVAAVFTGGTSWAPLSTTFEPVGALRAICCAHPAARSAAMPTLLRHRERVMTRRSVSIASPSLDRAVKPLPNLACERIYRRAAAFANTPGGLDGRRLPSHISCHGPPRAFPASGAWSRWCRQLDTDRGPD